MSRARLGLYIFARVSLFQNCFELTPAFNQLTARPLQLHIRPNEYYNQEQPVSTRSYTHTEESLPFPPLLYMFYTHANFHNASLLPPLTHAQSNPDSIF